MANKIYIGEYYVDSRKGKSAFALSHESNGDLTRLNGFDYNSVADYIRKQTQQPNPGVELYNGIPSKKRHSDNGVVFPLFDDTVTRLSEETGISDRGIVIRDMPQEIRFPYSDETSDSMNFRNIII